MFFTNQFDHDYPLLSRNPVYKHDADINISEVGYNRVPAGLWQTMKRDVYILHYIVKGKGVFMNQPFDENCGYFVAPHELETIHADNDDPYESYWIMFRGSIASEILKNFNLKHNCVFSFKHNKECAEIIRNALFREDYVNEIEEAYALQSVFYQLISVHMKDVEPNDIMSTSVAYQVANYIEKNYYNPIKIDTLAQNLHMSRNHLYSLFKQEYLVSPQEFLISYRIEKAKKLLVNKQIHTSIKEIALSVGFENPLYFSRLFHKRTGMSPSEFRKKADPHLIYGEWSQTITKK